MELKILQKLVKFNTISSRSNLGLINYVAAHCQKLGYKTKIQKRGVKANLFVYQPTSKPRAILSSHTDTVPASEGWKTDPFNLVEQKGALCGLGISDMKISIAISLSMLKLFQNKPNIAMLLTFDEETDFSGVKIVNDKIIRPCDTVILGEPTSNKAVFASKGATGFELTFFGKGGHGSEPEKGKSAIIAAKHFMHNFEAGFKKMAPKYTSDEFENPDLTYNFGKISGGDAINKIPEKCTLVFESRFMNEAQREAITNLVNNCANNLEVKTKVKQGLNIPAFSASKKIRDVFKSVKIPSAPGMSGATEASLMQRLTENLVIFGPGNMSQAHTVNEHISILAITKYENLLKKLLGKILG